MKEISEYYARINKNVIQETLQNEHARINKNVIQETLQNEQIMYNLGMGIKIKRSKRKEP